MQQIEIKPEDVMVVMDEPFYTAAGAMKLMGIGRTCLSREIREKRIAVFKHPVCDLFSKEAISAWILGRTTKVKK